MREQFLCQQVPPPPPDVDTNLPPVDEAKPVTNRERLAAHATNQMCVGCHNLIDPVGFGFEKFDAIGMRREKHKLLFFPAGSGVAARRAKPKEVELEIDTQGFVAGLENSALHDAQGVGRDCWRELRSVTNVLSSKSSGIWPDVWTRRLTVRCFARRWKLFGSPASVSKS